MRERSGIIEGTQGSEEEEEEGNREYQPGYQAQLKSREVMKAFGWMVRMDGGRCVLIKRSERRTVWEPTSYRFRVLEANHLCAMSASGQVTHHPCLFETFQVFLVQIRASP